MYLETINKQAIHKKEIVFINSRYIILCKMYSTPHSTLHFADNLVIIDAEKLDGFANSWVKQSWIGF